MQRLVYDFLQYEKRKGLKEATLADHVGLLRIFVEFIYEHYPDVTEITDIRRDMIVHYENYLVSMHDKRGKQLTRERRYRYLCRAKAFFSWLQREEKIFHNPAHNMAFPKLKTKVVRDVLSVEEMQEFLQRVKGQSAKEIRDRAILETLYSTGVRSDELCNIQLEDIDLKKGLLFIRKGKMDKERYVPFGESASYWLSRYLGIVRPLICEEDHGRVFVSMKGAVLNSHSLYYIIKELAREAGIEKNITTHTFRNTCATHMLKGRADIRYIQQQLGHRSMQTTEKYLKIEITDLKEVHERTHPREQEAWES